MTLAMLEILRGGGFTSGGLKFDAKLRRQSIDRNDLFHAHIGGMDTMARALVVAAAILDDGELDARRAERYAGWESASDITGGASLQQLHDAQLGSDKEPTRCQRSPGSPREPRRQAHRTRPLNGFAGPGTGVTSSETRAHVLSDSSERHDRRRFAPAHVAQGARADGVAGEAEHPGDLTRRRNAKVRCKHGHQLSSRRCPLRPLDQLSNRYPIGTRNGLDQGLESKVGDRPRGTPRCRPRAPSRRSCAFRRASSPQPLADVGAQPIRADRPATVHAIARPSVGGEIAAPARWPADCGGCSWPCVSSCASESTGTDGEPAREQRSRRDRVGRCTTGVLPTADAA